MATATYTLPTGAIIVAETTATYYFAGGIVVLSNAAAGGGTVGHLVGGSLLTSRLIRSILN